MHNAMAGDVTFLFLAPSCVPPCLTKQHDSRKLPRRVVESDVCRWRTLELRPLTSECQTNVSHAIRWVWWHRVANHIPRNQHIAIASVSTWIETLLFRLCRRQGTLLLQPPHKAEQRKEPPIRGLGLPNIWRLPWIVRRNFRRCIPKCRLLRSLSLSVSASGTTNVRMCKFWSKWCSPGHNGHPPCFLSTRHLLGKSRMTLTLSTCKHFQFQEQHVRNNQHSQC